MALAKEIGITDPPRAAGDIKRKIVEKLKGTNRPVFLDEAHLLPPSCFGRIRSLHDQTGVPIIMAGTHEILRRINDRSNGKGQFASRCYQFNAMDMVVNASEPRRQGDRPAADEQAGD